ncbi:hypothetical protein [Seonamhaeicola sp.]|uniref:hypothetical protein n=1 Tax=Seonamhaeicola sp. TaxID=1912245 RepID=UPI0026231C6C|nr:hypothetical protein [Seonamhaeicola sp.]
MKKTMHLLVILLVLSCCNKKDDDTPVNPIDQLPPATQTGENTFGCLLDGEAFLPGPGPLTLDCVYQFVSGDYYFALKADKEINLNLVGVGLGTQKLQIEEGKTYELEELHDGNAVGRYAFEIFTNYTSTSHSGEMSITKLDMEKNIVSGTFWYDIEDQDGNVHQIREGRFDMTFSE